MTRGMERGDTLGEPGAWEQLCYMQQCRLYRLRSVPHFPGRTWIWTYDKMGEPWHPYSHMIRI